jgi:hypothetical protein
MRIKVQEEKLIKAIKKLEGIDLIFKNVEEGIKDIIITQVVEHPTSAVEFTVFYEIEFVLLDERYTEMEIALIRELQGMFAKL